MLLQIKNLVAGYGKAEILRGVELSVDAGEAVALLGRNGAGKTTLVRSIMGLVPPKIWSGRIEFKTLNLRRMAPYSIARSGVALVPQGRRVFGSLTVYDNLTVGFGSASYWTLDDVFSIFPILRERMHQHAGTLSGGEQQMLAIGRALVTGPELLLMDEPSEGLAPSVLRQVESQIVSIRDDDRHGFLIVEQNLALAVGLADRICILDDGRIVFDDTPDSLDQRTINKYLAV